MTPEQRAELTDRLEREALNGRRRRHFQILLRADEGQTDEQVAAATGASRSTVERHRTWFAPEGLEAALTDKPRSGAPAKLDGKQEAMIVALACSDAPEGHARWSARLLASRAVALEVVETVSESTVRRILKKNALKPWQKRSWCIPKVSGEFVARMEDVLELDAEPLDEARPVVCMDELSKERHGQVAEPIPAEPKLTAKEDYEYTRNGTAHVFLRLCPLLGWRHLEVTEHRGYLDFARVMKALVDDHFPKAEKIRVVLDNLNTHVFGAWYEAFSREEARRIATRLEFHYTPKHGSWLNMAEMEFSVLARQCLSRRIETAEELRVAVAAWERTRNEARTKIEWSFRGADARKKLHWVYPS